MALSAALVAVALLLCVATTQAFNSPSEPAVDGIYNGRFGGDSIKVSAQAVFSQGGVVGNVVFTQSKPGDPVLIHLSLLGLDQYPDNYRWSVQEFPIRTSLLRPFPCSMSEIGGIFNPTNANTSCNTIEDCPVGNLGSRLGALRSDMPWQTFEDSTISLTGPDSIIGRSLVIDREQGPMGGFICANIERVAARGEILRAAFENGMIQGDVIIRYGVGRDDATIEADLHRVDPGITTGTGGWTINFGTAGDGNSCEDIDIVYGSTNYDEDLYNCGSSNQRECAIGDLTGKCGPLEFVDDRARVFCTDNQLGSIPRTYLFDGKAPENALLVAIRDDSGNFLGCAQLEMINAVTARTQLRYSSVFGDFLFWQSGPDDRTYLRASLTGLNEDDFSLRIHCNDCDDLGEIFSRPGGEFILPRQPGAPLTNDAGSIGALDLLVPLPPGQVSVRTTTSSAFLPLFGPFSVMGKSLALVREEDSRVVACNTIMPGPILQGELSSLLGYQDMNNPPLPPI